MVYQDISDSFQPGNSSQKKSTAHLMDRFFSFLIDYLVISPFVLFLLYSTFHNGFEFWKLDPDAPESNVFILILAFSYILFFSLIQSLFIAFWKATPGQYFLKIRIEFHESDDLIFFRALFRQMAFWFSFLFFGIPFLSMMTNKARRTFYDRVGDVSIISKKHEKDFFGFEKEYRYWQSFMATMVLFIGFLVSALIWKNYSKVLQRTSTIAVLTDKRFFCEELKNVSSEERLPAAVALNLASQLSDECLDKEADFVLWKQKKSDYSLAYYAKSLTTDDADREKDYLQQSCAGQDTGNFSGLTLGCKIADSFLNNKLEELYSALDEDNFLNDSMKYELSLILNTPDEIEKNFAKIEKYNSLKIIKKYQITEMLSHEKTNGRMPASADREQNSEVLKLIGEL